MSIFITQGKAGVAAVVESRMGLKGATLHCWQGCTLHEPLQSRGRMSCAIPFLEAVLSAGGVCMSVETSSSCLPLNHKQILKNVIPVSLQKSSPFRLR